MEIQTRLTNAVERGDLSTLCLLDVSSGYDTVSHTYLLRTLELYGYDNDSIEWLSSYLSNRSQVVQVQASRSYSVGSFIGFPQGGPKSPILFREYANDIPACMFQEHPSWKKGEEDEDEETIIGERELKRSCITRKIRSKKQDDKSEDEVWDEVLSMTENKIEN